MLLKLSPLSALTLLSLFFTLCYTKDDKEDKSDGSQLVEESECGCYVINGTAPTYYSRRKFFDFRSLSEFSGVPDALKNHRATSQAPPSSDYFYQDEWTGFWETQTWNNGVGIRTEDSDDGDNEQDTDERILMMYSANNIYVQDNEDTNASSDTFMTLRTKRLPTFQTAAEMESTDFFMYTSIRMLARTRGAPGAVTAIFTYRDSEKLADVQEADIEFVTRGPRDRVQYTNQPSYSVDGDNFPEATRNASTPGDRSWTDWMVHRLDWTPDLSVWYIDGLETARIEYQTPTDPAKIILNAWSNGGSWSGNMSDYDEAYLQIQWIDMVYNETSDYERAKRRRSREFQRSLPVALWRRDGDEDAGGSCDSVCSIDEVNEAGEIVQLWDNAALGMTAANLRVLSLTSSVAVLSYLLC